MKKKSLTLFFMIMLMEGIAANFAHPVTPTIIVNLNLPNYMFGLAFASMSITNFMFAPMWGKFVNIIGRIKVLSICCIGYAFGQFLLGNMTCEADMIIARMVSGFFLGGISVSNLAYVIEASDEQHRGTNLIYSASLSSVGGPIGYLLGGVIGTYSIPITFALQVFFLALAGILLFIFIEDMPFEKKNYSMKEILSEANPLVPFMEIKKHIQPTLMLFFTGVTFASFAATAYDQCFNYYIKDVYNFIPAYNGFVKAIIGIIVIVTNMTINKYLIKKTNIRKTVIYIFFIASISCMMVMFMKPLPLFVLCSLCYYAANAIYVPTQQNIMSMQTNPDNRSQILGFFSSMGSLGMVAGSLFAGFIYDYGKTIPFGCASVCFFICTLISYRLFS